MNQISTLDNPEGVNMPFNKPNLNFTKSDSTSFMTIVIWVTTHSKYNIRCFIKYIMTNFLY